MRARVALVLCALGVGSTAHADRRLFTHTFEYRTIAPGATNLELWHTEARQTWDADTSQTLTHRMQVTHGLTEQWDASLSLELRQVAGDAAIREPLAVHDVKLMTRYRFVDRGQWPVDLQLQLEAAKHFGESIYDTALRVVVAKDYGRFTVAGNVLGIAELGRDARDEPYDIGWAAGATYDVHAKLNVGVEAFGVVGDDQVALGPALALAPARSLWLTVTAALALVDDTPALSARVILGIELP